MGKNNKIHIPGRTRKHLQAGQAPVVRLSVEAYNALVDVYNESTLSMSQVASIIIMESKDNIVYDREEG